MGLYIRNFKNVASWVAMFVVLVAMFALSGCKQTEYVTIDRVRTDSVFRQVTDTVTIRVRVADYSYRLPSVLLERETRDTVSVLQDSLYRSVARVCGGVLYHSLATVPDAKVTVSANVADTTKSKTTDTYSGMTETRAVPVFVEKDYSTWDKVRLWAFYPLLVVFLLAVGFVVYKISR